MSAAEILSVRQVVAWSGCSRHGCAPNQALIPRAQIRVYTAEGQIMQAEIGSLVGRPVLDITAPADRLECGAAIDRLRATRMPFEVTKRFIRDDGGLIWVTNSVSMVGNGRDTDLIVATISPIVEPDAPRAPALLLDCARLLVELHVRRSENHACLKSTV